MASKTLVEELIDSLDNDKHKRIIEKFKQKSTIKELKGEIDSQIQEELDET